MLQTAPVWNIVLLVYKKNIYIYIYIYIYIKREGMAQMALFDLHCSFCNNISKFIYM